MGARRLEGAAPTKVLSPASLTRRRVPIPEVSTARWALGVVPSPSHPEDTALRA